MFCKNCGTKLEGGKFCPHCGTPVSDTAEIATASGQVEPAPQTPPASEEYVVLEESTGGFLKDGAWGFSTGRIVLTNRRILYFEKASVKKAVLLGALAFLSSGDFDCEILLSDIESMKVGRVRLAKGLTIKTRSGKTYSLTGFSGLLSNMPNQWYDAIQKLHPIG